MNYSFTTVEQKPLFSKFTSLCIKFLILIVFIIIAFAIYIQIKQNLAYDEHTKIKIKNNEVLAQIVKIKEKIKNTQGKLELINDIKASNINLKKSIKNLLDLVPDSIVLSEVEMEQKSLVIKGSTPTKEIYKNLLQAPLKSIFESSKTNFIQQKSGWYNFTSVNFIDNSEGFNE